MVQITGSHQGRSFPLGATVYPEGVNFSVFSRYATALELVLFKHVEDLMPSGVTPLDPQLNRTYYYWHVFIPGITAGQLYGYRAHGPFEPEEGHRFNPVKVLLDPYGKCIARPDGYTRKAACQPTSRAPAMKSVVVDPGVYDWGDDVPLRIPFTRSVLYELHIGGFTKHPTSGVAPDRRGTYAGLIEKIPYLRDLGVTAVELLPVYAFDEQDCPPVLSDIESDPVLANVKLIAEAWDAAGLYQVGHFPGESWKEWNGRFRDDVRSFVKGDNGMAKAVAYRLVGSPDIYLYRQREPEVSINFVTCHDGFTLNDVVSYHDKHNEANREANRDGGNDNRSWNCGVEGPTDDPHVERLRNRQVKNFLALTLLSAGTPMLLMGDEMRRSQGGNNNAYCQDNEISWFDWSLVDRHADVKRFATNAHCAARQSEPPGQSIGHDVERTPAPGAGSVAWSPIESCWLG